MIHAWKAFIPDGQHPVLRSLVVRHEYAGPVATGPPPLLYTALQGGPVYDGDPCTELGFYAFRDAQDLLCEYHRGEFALEPLAVAEVSLYGKVIEHELGYRAQSLRFDRIYLQDRSLGLQHEFEQTFQCEVTRWQALAKKSVSTRSSPSV